MSHGLTVANNETVNKVIWWFQEVGLISKNIVELLENENPQTPHFYLNINYTNKVSSEDFSVPPWIGALQRRQNLLTIMFNQ